MFNIRYLNETDYDMLCQWWKWHRFPAPLKICLPDNGTNGLIVSKDGVNICCGFVYQTNSKMAWIEFIVSNPDYRQSDRKDAINYLIEMLCELAKGQGFLVAFTSVKNESLIKRYEDSGFLKGSIGTLEMVKIL